MKANIFKITTMMLIIVCWSCQNKSEAEQSASPDSISSNLSKNGKIDPVLLVGEWDIIKFAYTADGSKISDVATINSATLKIPFAPTPLEHDAESRWRLDCVNSNWFICSISGNNLIELTLRGSTFIGVPPDHEENHIMDALNNVYSFVIRNDELIIYYTRVENKNLLILKKR